MTTEFHLPHLGEEIESGDVLTLLVSEGDQVAAEQGVMEIETDKATVEVPSPVAGRVAKIHVAEGNTVPVGALLLTIEESAETASAPPAAAPPEPVAATPPPAPAPIEAPAPAPAAAPTPTNTAVVAPPQSAPPTPAPAPTEPKPAAASTSHVTAPAGPAVRRLARELGVDLALVVPAGSDGRLTKEDVLNYVRRTTEQAAEASAAADGVDQDAWGSIRREALTKIRQTIAQKMTESYSQIPQLTNFDDADITDLEKIRQASKQDYARQGIKLTTLPFVLKAVAASLKAHPTLNASLDDQSNEIIYKQYVSIGIAVDTERGLVVPVMRNVDQMSVQQIAVSLGELATNTREGKFAIEDLRGSTFTVSNLGAVGGSYSTPIINPPNVAILLPGRARRIPMAVEDHVEPRLMLPLSLTYDHRLVDGAAAARFLNEVKGFLESPGRLLIAP